MGRYAKLEEEMERGNQEFIDQQRNQQQVCVCVCVCVSVCECVSSCQLCVLTVCHTQPYSHES